MHPDQHVVGPDLGRVGVHEPQGVRRTEPLLNDRLHRIPPESELQAKPCDRRAPPQRSPPLYPVKDQIETESELLVVVVARLAEFHDDLEEERILVGGGWVLFG